jgi:hypothetical protein
MVGKYSTYGMAGVGIAAAIGFVFALTVLNSNNNPIDTGTDNPEVAQRLETQPNEASSFFFEQQQQREQEPIADGGQQAGDASAQSKERDQAAGSDLSQQEMTILQQEATDLRPTLSSLVSVNGTTGEVITEVVPGSLFAVGKPFFIQAHFTNPNEKDVPDHTLVMTLAHNGTGGDAAEQPASDDNMLVQTASFRGDISANENVDLEFYWNPDIEGEYVLVIFSLTPTELSERESSEPVLSVSIQAVDE